MYIYIYMYLSLSLYIYIYICNYHIPLSARTGRFARSRVSLVCFCRRPYMFGDLVISGEIMVAKFGKTLLESRKPTSKHNSAFPQRPRRQGVDAHVCTLMCSRGGILDEKSRVFVFCSSCRVALSMKSKDICSRF